MVIVKGAPFGSVTARRLTDTNLPVDREIETMLGRAVEQTGGMLASIVLLRENPLEDIAATLSIEVAVSRGDVFDRQTLDRMLDQAATQASALDTTRRDLQSR